MKGMASSKEPAFASRRFQILGAFATLFLCVLIVRLYVLQIQQGAEYRKRSESNFVQERRISHSRGLIYDRTGKVLADNRPSHDVYVTAAFLPDSTRSLRRLLLPLGATREEINALDEKILAAIDAPDDRVFVGGDASRSDCHQALTAISRHDLRGVHVVWRSSDDVDGCRIQIRAREFPSRTAVFRHLQELLEISDDEWSGALKRMRSHARGLGRFKSTLLLEDVGFEGYARVKAAASLGELPGIDVFDSQRRRYLGGTRAAHVLGFMNELSQAELAEKKDEGYRLGDLVGRRGLEAAFEDTLRGTDGVRKVVVDAKGRDRGSAWADQLLGEDRTIAPESGASLVLTIDEKLQQVAEEAFLGKAGSVVAIDPRTGFVLALASFPAFDPNRMTGRQSGTAWGIYRKDPLKPLTNKAIQDHYAPGSTFKAITALAGLEHDHIHRHSRKVCPGYFRLGRATWRCYNRGGHGSIALIDALKRSCDTYFYSLGYEMGPDKLAETSREFGFGTRSGIGIDREIPGIMPDRAYYVKHFGAYTPGLVVNSSIGQGDVTATPLQLAMAYSAIANGGRLLQPRVVRAIVEEDGTVRDEFGADLRWPINVSDEDLAAVRESLSHVTEKGGTAYGLQWRRDMPEVAKWVRDGSVVIGGKTGTAQVARLPKHIAHIDPEDMEYELRDHAWFVGFAPAEDPEIVVAAMTEHGGFGGSMSAPVVAKIMHAWFTDRKDAAPLLGAATPALEIESLLRSLDAEEEAHRTEQSEETVVGTESESEEGAQAAAEETSSNVDNEERGEPEQSEGANGER